MLLSNLARLRKQINLVIIYYKTSHNTLNYHYRGELGIFRVFDKAPRFPFWRKAQCRVSQLSWKAHF